MDAYRCAYRDPKSPLTPINPLKTQNFQCGSSRKSLLSSSTLKSTLSSSSKSLLSNYSSLTPNFTLKSTLSSGTKTPLKSTLSPRTNKCSYCSTPSSSRISSSSKSIRSTSGLGGSTMALTPKTNLDGTFVKKSSNVSSSTTRNSQKNVAQKMTEKISYRNGEVVKVTRSEQIEEVYFRVTSPCSPTLALCPRY